MLQCNAKGCTSNNFPLKFAEAELEEIEADYNADFLKRMIPKLEWKALVETAFSVGFFQSFGKRTSKALTPLPFLNKKLGIDTLPKELPENIEDEEFLQKLHHVILETRVKEGKMICNNCGHVFPITDGIPNMLLNEEEV